MKNILFSFFFSIISIPVLAQSQPVMADVTAEELKQIIQSYEGDKAVLVNFWATWCLPCKREFPHLLELREKYSDRFELIFVSADFEEARQEAREFLKNQDVDFKTYFKTEKDNEFITAVSENWSGALPFTIIIDKDGNLVNEWEGAASLKTFETELTKAFEALN